MKKFLLGALALLAAVVITSCTTKKQGKNQAETVTSLSLNKTELVMAPEETAQLRATTNTGEVKTYVWESSNQDVVTVSDKGLVTAMSYGQANIICSLKENAEIKTVCQITVESKLKTLKFTRATVSLPRAIDSTIVYDIPTNSLDSLGNKIILKAYLAEINVFLYSDGFYLNNDAIQVSEDKNKAFCVYVPTHTYVVTANLNPQFFTDPAGYEVWTTGAELYRTSSEVGPRMVKAGTIDEIVYMTHMHAAFDSWNKYIVSNDEEDYYNYWVERYAAVNEGMSGALLYQYEYDEKSGEYNPHANPSAIVTDLAVRLTYGDDDLKYMYAIAAYQITVKPLGGLFGCDVKQNSVTYEYTFESEDVIYEDLIHYEMTQSDN